MTKAKDGGLGRGYVSMFGRKAGGMWISGTLSPGASAAFLRAQARLEDLYSEVNGGAYFGAAKTDVIEYLLRGPVESRREFERLKAEGITATRREL